MRMPLHPTDEQLHKIAEKRINIKRNFIIHLLTYVCFNAVLVSLSYIVKGYVMDWILLLVGGWGIKIALDAADLYTNLRMTLNNKTIKKEMNKIRENHKIE